MDVETLDCDVCNAKITDFENDLFHFSGKLKNKISGHIHLCAKCKEYLKPPIFDFDEALQKRKLILKGGARTSDETNAGL